MQKIYFCTNPFVFSHWLCGLNAFAVYGCWDGLSVWPCRCNGDKGTGDRRRIRSSYGTVGCLCAGTDGHIADTDGHRKRISIANAWNGYACPGQTFPCTYTGKMDRNSFACYILFAYASEESLCFGRFYYILDKQKYFLLRKKGPCHHHHHHQDQDHHHHHLLKNKKNKTRNYSQIVVTKINRIWIFFKKKKKM